MRVGRSAWLVLLAAWTSVGPASPARAGYDELIDSPMYQDPAIPLAPVAPVLPPRTRALWLRALERPEVEMRIRAADAFALASRRGYKGFDDAVPALTAALERPDQHPTVRLAAARALTALDVREAAPALLRHTLADPDLRDVADPALVRWKFEPARAVWLARLADPHAPAREVVQAAQALAAVGEAAAAETLRQRVLDRRQPPTVRLEAARALAALRAEGLEADAGLLAADTSPYAATARLAAAALLRQHRGGPAVALLKTLAGDAQPAVATAAVVRLLELDPELVRPLAPTLAGSPDAGLRGQAVETFRRLPSVDHVARLAARLDDPHPDVRRQARRALEELAADAKLRPAVEKELTGALAASSWRSQEQAAILAARIGHKPAAARLVDLLTSERPEVAVTVAWALRRLAVPETYPAIIRHADVQLRRLQEAVEHQDRRLPRDVIDFQGTQLLQLLGREKYAPAEAMIRRWVPRIEKPLMPPFGPETRAAPRWALGLMHENRPDPALAAEVEGRLRDTQSVPPEDLRVLRMAAITLARLQAKESLPALRDLCPRQELTEGALNNTCAWAIARLSGEPLPPVKPIPRVQRDWFLISDE